MHSIFDDDLMAATTSCGGNSLSAEDTGECDDDEDTSDDHSDVDIDI